MDLLTTDGSSPSPFSLDSPSSLFYSLVPPPQFRALGWLSSYSIPAVLLQIRMAMSNLEPRPARLDPQSWNVPYEMVEAVAGFKRAAATHGWKVPEELEAIARGG